MDDKPADMSPVSAAQARRVLALKRAYQRELGHKPTTIQKSLIDRAAVMTAKAEAAALDSTVTANDCVRLDNTANRARCDVRRLQGAARRRAIIVASAINGRSRTCPHGEGGGAMTEPAEAEALFSELVERHGGSGGIDRLSGLDREVIGIVCKLLIETRTAPHSEVARLASTISQLTATLPTPSADNDDTFDIRRLTDDELADLERIQNKACNIDAPLWEPEPSTERQPGPCELEAIRLGQYLDEHNHEWRHRPLLEPERAVLMNMFGGLGFCAGIIVRNLFRPIFMADAQAEIEKAVRAALIASGSDARMVPMTPEEKARLAPPALLDGPPEPPRTNGAGDLTAVWPFSPDKPPQ